MTRIRPWCLVMPASCNRCSQIYYSTPGMQFPPAARLGFPPFLPRTTHLQLKCPIAEWESPPKTSPRFMIRSIQLKELGEEPGSVSQCHTGLCRSIRAILALKVIQGVVQLFVLPCRRPMRAPSYSQLATDSKDLRSQI